MEVRITEAERAQIMRKIEAEKQQNPATSPGGNIRIQSGVAQDHYLTDTEARAIAESEERRGRERETIGARAEHAQDGVEVRVSGEPGPEEQEFREQMRAAGHSFPGESRKLAGRFENVQDLEMAYLELQRRAAQQD